MIPASRRPSGPPACGRCPWDRGRRSTGTAAPPTTIWPAGRYGDRHRRVGQRGPHRRHAEAGIELGQPGGHLGEGEPLGDGDPGDHDGLRATLQHGQRRHVGRVEPEPVGAGLDLHLLVAHPEPEDRRVADDLVAGQHAAGAGDGGARAGRPPRPRLRACPGSSSCSYQWCTPKPTTARTATNTSRTTPSLGSVRPSRRSLDVLVSSSWSNSGLIGRSPRRCDALRPSRFPVARAT